MQEAEQARPLRSATEDGSLYLVSCGSSTDIELSSWFQGGRREFPSLSRRHHLLQFDRIAAALHSSFPPAWLCKQRSVELTQRSGCGIPSRESIKRRLVSAGVAICSVLQPSCSRPDAWCCLPLFRVHALKAVFVSPQRDGYNSMFFSLLYHEPNPFSEHSAPLPDTVRCA